MSSFAGRSNTRSGSQSFGSISSSIGGKGYGLKGGSVHIGTSAGSYKTCISQPSHTYFVGQPRSYAVTGGIGSNMGAGWSSSLGLGASPGYSSSTGVSYTSGTAVGVDGSLGSGAAFKLGAGTDAAGGTGILGNEKFTMRTLNDRLASYITKVNLLAKTNTELELKIRQFVDTRTSPTEQDYSDSLSTINDLQAKILEAILLKSTVQINLDNASLAADDFRMKYENELANRQSVEADIAGLKRLQDEIDLQMKELNMHIDTLNEEKVYLKKVHDEEMVTTRSQMSGQIHVEVEAPEQDLTVVLEDIRDHYESVAVKNRRDLESWFKNKLEVLKQEVVTSAQTVATSSTEMTTEKNKVQSLELELQSVLAVKASLGAKLLEIQAFYSAHLSGYQLQVTGLEEELLQLRTNLERQCHEYQILLDIKSKLELEILEYRRLMDLGIGGSIITATDKSRTKAETKTKNEGTADAKSDVNPDLKGDENADLKGDENTDKTTPPPAE